MTGTIDAERAAALEQAFALFNAHSRELQESWDGLQQRVAELTRERDAADQARLRELAAKEQLAERLQALLEALPGATLMLDADGRIRDANAGARELLGEPLLDCRWSDVAARALRAQTDADGTPQLSNGRHVGVSRRGLPDGGSVLLLTDDSEAHARRSGVERQRRLSAIDAMNARLAHQLRTPLATAVLYLSQLATNDLDAATCRRLGGKALAPLRQLQELIDGTLALARGHLDEAECIALDELLAMVGAQAAAKLGNGGRLLADAVAAGASVRGQRSLLCSALLNLVDNGLAVADTVRLSAVAHEDGWRIRVQDNGPGVDPALAERIFEPFFTTRGDGTGLGLALSRAIAEAHGGRLQLLPGDRGACFGLDLPGADSGRLLPSGPSTRTRQPS